MNTQSSPSELLESPPISVQAKLAAAWTSVMFFFIYVDYFALYKPGTIDDLLVGIVFEFDITQTLLVMFLIFMAIPIFMILLSMTLPARLNRTVNLIVGSANILFAMFNIVGESWIFFYGIPIVLEVGILVYILRTAWTWPRVAHNRHSEESRIPRVRRNAKGGVAAASPGDASASSA